MAAVADAAAEALAPARVAARPASAAAVSVAAVAAAVAAAAAAAAAAADWDRTRNGRGQAGRGGRGPFNGQFASIGNRRRTTPPVQGSVAVTVRNSAFNAAPYSLNGQTAQKPYSANNNLNANIGGPLHIPKIVNWQRAQYTISFGTTINRNGRSMVGSVPTAAERGGDFSQALATTPVTIYDPTSGVAVSQQRDSHARDSTAPRRGCCPIFRTPPTPGIVQNYRFVITDPSTSHNIGVRFNAPLSNKDRLNFNFQKQSQNSNSHQLFGFLDTGESSGLSFSAGWSHSFRPRLNNSANFSISRSRNLTSPYFAYTQNIAAQLGITGTSQDPINYGPPGISFTNFSSLSDGTPNLGRNQTATFTDNFTYVLKRKHNLTFGFSYNRLQQNSQNYQNARGSFSFSGLVTSQLDADGQPVKGTGFDFADFLLGLPQSSSVRFGSSNNYFRSWSTNAYAQDDFRVSARLTINVGLRYEYFAPYTELQRPPGEPGREPRIHGGRGGHGGAERTVLRRAAEQHRALQPAEFFAALRRRLAAVSEAEHADPQRLQHLLQRIFVRADCQPDGRAAAVCHVGVADHQHRRAADAYRTDSPLRPPR